LRATHPLQKKLLFIAGGATFSMLSVALGLWASRLPGTLPGMAKPALLLAGSSGFGAASYALLFGFCFQATLVRHALVSVTLGCVVSSLAVLASGIYHQSGALWFAVAWWFAYSIGFWHQDRPRSK